MFREIFQAQEDGAKAIPYRVQLTDAGGPLLGGGGPAAYNDYNGFNQNVSPSNKSPLQQREARVHLQTYGGTEAVDWLYDAVDFTVSSASAADWRFDDAGTPLELVKRPNAPTDTKLAPQPAVDLFKKPNPFMEWKDLCEITLIDFLLVGNAYWVKWQLNGSNQPLALYRMCPEYVKIIPGQFGPEGYRYKLPGMTEDMVLTPEQVVHFKRPNPHDPYYGLGVVQAGARALDMEIELTKTSGNYYRKGTLPSGVVQTERRVPRDVFNKLKNQLRGFYSGSDNAGSLMVLEAGLTYKALSPNASEAMFKEMGGWSRDRVLSLFKMNKSLLGIWEQGDNPNTAQWQTLFDQKTMIPLTKKFAEKISLDVTQPGWGIDFCIDYQETQQPDEVLNRAGTLAKLPGVMVHEVRRAANLPPTTGDDTIDQTVLNLPGPNMDANGQNGVADPNLPGEAGNPPLPENTQQFQRRTGTTRAPAARAGGTSAAAGKKSMEERLANIKALVDTLENAKALAPADHVHIGKLAGDHVKPPAADVLFSKRTTSLDAAVADTTAQLADAAHSLERSLMDATEGKAEGTVYQRVKNSKAWKTFSDRLESILSESAQNAMSLSNVHHGAQGLDAANLDYEAESKSIVHRKEGGVSSLLSTIKQKVLDSVLAGQRKGDPNPDIQTALQAETTTWQQNNAPQIALDTATMAYNHGTLAVAAENGADSVLVSDGMDYDEPCIEANGQTWPLDKARENLQEHSRCRRAFVPVTA